MYTMDTITYIKRASITQHSYGQFLIKSPFYYSFTVEYLWGPQLGHLPKFSCRFNKEQYRLQVGGNQLFAA